MATRARKCFFCGEYATHDVCLACQTTRRSMEMFPVTVPHNRQRLERVGDSRVWVYTRRMTA